eukprot:754398-Hanusia_phi.AAC.4
MHFKVLCVMLNPSQAQILVIPVCQSVCKSQVQLPTTWHSKSSSSASHCEMKVTLPALRCSSCPRPDGLRITQPTKCSLLRYGTKLIRAQRQRAD